MHVFITGGTGLIGSAVTSELIEHGHSALLLARSDASSARAEAAGATVLRGELSDLDVVRAGADQAEGVIHLAFSNDFSSYEAVAKAVAEESAALAAISDQLIGSDKPLVAVSGTPFTPGRASTEDDALAAEGPTQGRNDSIEHLLKLSEQRVRSSAIRMPRTVHNNGEGGFAGLLADFARRSGTSGYPGDGQQRWPAVHALDAAVLFRLVLESAPAGTSWHAVAEEGVRVADIAAVIGRRLGLSVETVPEENFGPLGAIFAIDQPASSAHTREALGWQPTHPGLLEDLENMSV